METIQISKTGVVLLDPIPLVVTESVAAAGTAEEAFSIDVQGQGQLVGLAYTVPAHASGKIVAELQTSALTSGDVDNLNNLAMGMLDASYREETKEYEKTSASANVSLWSWTFGGGANASYEKTRETMKSKGLTDEQISELMEAFLERAQSMSTVKIEFFVNNSANDYSVSGDLYLYTVSGSVKTSKGTAQYRMLADQGSAGGPPPSGGGAPSAGNIILN